MNVLNLLRGKSFLWQVGFMYSRKSKKVRIFTNLFHINDALEFIKELRWCGSFEELELALAPFKRYISPQIILDFDIDEEKDGISETLGFNLHIDNYSDLKTLIKRLYYDGICDFEIANDLVNWNGKDVYRYGEKNYVFIQRGIAHFKVKLDREKSYSLKVYLRAEVI